MKVFDGAKMRAIRKEAGLTQYDLAPIVGITQNRVSDIERNVTDPTTIEIDAFAEALNSSISAFLNDETEIVVVTNTFTKKKKADNASSSSEEIPSEQLELLPGNEGITGHDLAGYILVRQDVYLYLLDSKDKLQQLRSLLKRGVE
ncbi:helix-turn-helix transcriptional regulator [Streptococcus anginosus]|uniref:helix-turn-helix domain-containing protein n=2 Tax=Bacillati TaxID=1783272 RepID=UPI001431B41C|nr:MULTISPECIES: helix-turn-helix transcriptional regulator [Bacteria]MBU5590108.1 helix-turn-helix transcriptional regulator [Streptococcus anginosus]MDU7641301.1 helix-turn-helix transcriptional regulator [Streptococcus anginosus]MED5789144.1 helix-turn-helix transcriptional regulator [Streptococcus anginosus]MED5834380.1 helix-turn-helix transcriptional regulator [Streptococcus anginosus]MED5836333.1 helix-turn-helix transcriptional regulator [Streptococcus anginosus]